MSTDGEPGARPFSDPGGDRPAHEAKESVHAARDDDPQPDRPSAYRRAENAIVDWARAIALGVRDTAKDVLEEGRSGARAKQSQMWDKFDRKTKGRRRQE